MRLFVAGQQIVSLLFNAHTTHLRSTLMDLPIAPIGLVVSIIFQSSHVFLIIFNVYYFHQIWHHAKQKYGGNKWYLHKKSRSTKLGLMIFVGICIRASLYGLFFTNTIMPYKSELFCDIYVSVAHTCLVVASILQLFLMVQILKDTLTTDYLKYSPKLLLTLDGILTLLIIGISVANYAVTPSSIQLHVVKNTDYYTCYASSVEESNNDHDATDDQSPQVAIWALLASINSSIAAIMEIVILILFLYKLRQVKHIFFVFHYQATKIYSVRTRAFVFEKRT